MWHAHWVVLIKDSRVAGGLSVMEFDYMSAAPKLPPTSAPGMHMYMDSPGFTVTVQGNTGRVVVPLDRILAARLPGHQHLRALARRARRCWCGGGKWNSSA